MTKNVFGVGVEMIILERWSGKFSQTRAAKELDINPSRISKIIDRNGDPKLSTMIFWSQLLDVPVNEIFKLGEKSEQRTNQ